MFVISTRNFPPDVGGIQNLMEGLSNSLLNHGPVKVFADSFEESEIYDKRSSLIIERISGFKIFKKYRKANIIKSFLKENNVRAVFFDHWKSIENMDEDLLSKTKSFCLIHSKEINHSPNSGLNTRMLKALNKSDYIIANSVFTKKLAIKNGLKEEIIKVINPGSDYPLKVEQKFKNKANELFKDAFPKILTVARLDRRKSHRNILMTIKNLKVKFPKIKYISLGDGEEKSNLENLKKELGLENEVDLIYKAEGELKDALLESSDLFLMPSVIYKRSVEGFGISFIEAASYGKASIGGIDGGEGDAIKNNLTGYLCDGNDLNSIYETVTKIFKDENYKKLGTNAYKFSRNFSWKIIIKKYLELI
jgi:phosphatidylinositol alpha-1,6-mannosyltransferase